MNPRRRLLAIAATIAAVLLACTSCNGTGGWITPPPTNATTDKPVVAIVGDSLTSDDHDTWADSDLGDRAHIAMWAVAGARYEHVPDGWIENLSPTPDRLVIALGANNANTYGTSEGWTDADAVDLRHIVWDARRAPGVIPCIVLVTVAPAPFAPLTYRSNAGHHNNHIRALAAASPVYRLADWASVASGRADWFRDVIHHTPAGGAAYRATITAAADRCPA